MTVEGNIDQDNRSSTFWRKYNEAISWTVLIFRIGNKGWNDLFLCPLFFRTALISNAFLLVARLFKIRRQNIYSVLSIPVSISFALPLFLYRRSQYQSSLFHLLFPCVYLKSLKQDCLSSKENILCQNSCVVGPSLSEASGWRYMSPPPWYSLFGASLKRAPQLRVDLAFCHDIYIYIYIYIYRPADLCLWSGARRQDRMLRAKSSRRNFVWERSSVLVHACSFTFVFEFVTDRTCQSLAFAFDCQHWTTGQKILGLLKNAIKSKKPGLSFASGPAGIETSFLFSDLLAHRESLFDKTTLLLQLTVV